MQSVSPFLCAIHEHLQVWDKVTDTYFVLHSQVGEYCNLNSFKINVQFKIPLVIYPNNLLCMKHLKLDSLDRRLSAPVVLIQMLYRALQAKPLLETFAVILCKLLFFVAHQGGGYLHLLYLHKHIDLDEFIFEINALIVPTCLTLIYLRNQIRCAPAVVLLHSSC